MCVCVCLCVSSPPLPLRAPPRGRPRGGAAALKAGAAGGPRAEPARVLRGFCAGFARGVGAREPPAAPWRAAPTAASTPPPSSAPGGAATPTASGKHAWGGHGGGHAWGTGHPRRGCLLGGCRLEAVQAGGCCVHGCWGGWVTLSGCWGGWVTRGGAGGRPPGWVAVWERVRRGAPADASKIHLHGVLRVFRSPTLPPRRALIWGLKNPPFRSRIAAFSSPSCSFCRSLSWSRFVGIFFLKSFL